MNYLLIGTLLGSIITSPHDTREACEGRAVLLREKGATVQCVTNTHTLSTSGTVLLCGNSTCGAR